MPLDRDILHGRHRGQPTDWRRDSGECSGDAFAICGVEFGGFEGAASGRCVAFFAEIYGAVFSAGLCRDDGGVESDFGQYSGDSSRLGGEYSVDNQPSGDCATKNGTSWQVTMFFC